MRALVVDILINADVQDTGEVSWGMMVQQLQVGAFWMVTIVAKPFKQHCPLFSSSL